ncbi:C10 family peptidase [Hoylesella nanceiensis]|uniref:C10 family peptidase n=1 Tax=Hoylesella nanceiensis TaxID=425941 RepID=UPI001CAC67EC|nr:C10 family peptidase [Hoylesella nanceiensis]MBF1429412.1 C10 family peptidase [Hoylesella nanceiensis]
MKRTLLFALTVLANSVLASANPITKGQALNIASKYISNPTLSNNTPKTRSLKANEQPAYYIFTSSNDDKFVIVSGESKLNEVVAYGDKMSKDESKQSPYFKQFLKDYERVVKAVRSNTIQASTTPSQLKRKVEPLLTCKWSQYFPYNKYTPVIQGDRTPTGCVATATAQVMYHHKWPKNRPADYIASTGDEARKSSTYWWDDMKDTSNKMFSSRSQQAVGVLMYDIGKAVRMRYYHKGSDSNLQNACNALRHNFDYTVRYLVKDVLPANEFLKEVMQELSDGYPVLVVGGPHAFVYDGYDEQGFIHTNWGWGGQEDGYFDINTVYLNVSGFALSGTFWDDISVVFAHPNNGIATPFKDIERALYARLTTTFTINKTQGARNESFSAEIKKVGAYSSAKEGLGVFTGKVALALYNDQNKRIKIFNSNSDNITWATIFNAFYFDVHNINFAEMPNGNYRLVPVYSEMLDPVTKENGEWKPINYANEIQVELTSTEVRMNENNPKDDVTIEKAPSVLVPFYEDSGMAAFSFTMYNPGREEVRGDLVMTLTNKATNEEFIGNVINYNVVAQRLGHTSFTIRMLAQHYKPGFVGPLAAGKYDVKLGIKAKRNGSEVVIPIKMLKPFELEIFPKVLQGTIEFNYVDFLVDGKEANYSTFELSKINQIGLQVHSKLTGYLIRDGYRGPLYYRLYDLTADKWIEVGSKNNVYLPYNPSKDVSSTRITFPASQLEANHSYEVHVEIERNGRREDLWNVNTFRNTFHVVDELKATGIGSLESENKAPKHIYNVQGVRQTQAWDTLPAGIYIVDGKKIMKK